MKKINFSDRYGLTQAVLDRLKWKTRRIITCPKSFKGQEVGGFYVYRRMSDNAALEYPIMCDADGFNIEGAYILPKYKVGEVVAIAQAYKGIACGALYDDLKEIIRNGKPETLAGWTNKMFVRADLMPHRIRITYVRVERLQDISEDDCIAEGVDSWMCQGKRYYGFFDYSKDKFVRCNTPIEAYAALIDKISGRGTWNSNPYVFAYTFELVK